MKYIYDNMHISIVEIFNDIFHGKESFRYKEKGMQCYKFYLFIFLWGSIREVDYPYIFSDEEVIHEKSGKELKNIFRNRINYWVQKKEIEKIDQEGFILAKNGIQKLYEHLSEFYPADFKDIAYKDFKSRYSARRTNVNHTSNIGITVLKLSKFIESVFWHEPMLDYAGDMLAGTFFRYNDCMLIPDAVVYTSLGETIYVEADNCTERKNTSLIPKFSKYSSIMNRENENYVNETIHVSVLHAHNSEDFESKYYNYSKVIRMYKFIIHDMGNKMTIDQWLTFIMSYQGNYEPAVQCAEFLKNIAGESEFVSSKELMHLINRGNLYDLFDKYFASRQKYIFEAAASCSYLCQNLLRGVRFICLPMHISDYLLPCIYIEYMKKQEIADFLECKLKFDFDDLKCLFDTKVFEDYRSGEIFTFKHVYLLNNREEKYYIAFENISDDYGGRLRVKHYVKNLLDISERLYVVCLYNTRTLENPLSLFRHREGRLRQCKILFATYESFLEYKEISERV